MNAMDLSEYPSYICAANCDKLLLAAANIQYTFSFFAEQASKQRQCPLIVHVTGKGRRQPALKLPSAIKETVPYPALTMAYPLASSRDDSLGYSLRSQTPPLALDPG